MTGVAGLPNRPINFGSSGARFRTPLLRQDAHGDFIARRRPSLQAVADHRVHLSADLFQLAAGDCFGRVALPQGFFIISQ